MNSEEELGRNLREFRRQLLDTCDDYKLESLDQSFELFVLLVGLGLFLFQLILPVFLTHISTLLNILNIVLTGFFWVAYKIARIKLAIDLRLLAINLTLQFFGAFAIVSGTSIVVSYLPDMYFSHLIVMAVAYLGGLTVFSAWADRQVEQLWKKLQRDSSNSSTISLSPYNQRRAGLYLVDKMRVDSTPSVMLIYAIFILGRGDLTSLPVLSFGVIMAAGFLLMIITDFNRMKRIQRELFLPGQ